MSGQAGAEAAQTAPELTLTRSESAALLRLATYATEQSGIRLPSSKLSMLHGRIGRRMRALGLATVAAYADKLLSSDPDDAERVQFLDAITTNKTEFFREPQHFVRLCNRVLPAMAADLSEPAHWHLRVWCAGCSMGQEPYTLAMVLSEYAKVRRGFTFSITATDLSTRALATAAKAIYAERDAGGVPDALRADYLMRSKDQVAGLVRVVPELRARISFQRLNFMSDHYALNGPFDLIFFRNVLIYFDRPTQEAVIRRQCELLRPGGYLFVSHSETLAGLDVPLQALGGSIFRKPHE